MGDGRGEQVSGGDEREGGNTHSLSDCMAKCHSNTMCNAFSYLPNMTRCLLWTGQPTGSRPRNFAGEVCYKKIGLVSLQSTSPAQTSRGAADSPDEWKTSASGAPLAASAALVW